MSPAMSKITNTFALVAALISSVAGHTAVEEFEAGGVTYPGFYQGSKQDPGNNSPAWWTNQQWGYQPVYGDKINHPDIIAHIDASPSPYTAPVPAGSDVTFKWHHEGQCEAGEEGWDCSHHGWTATYLASCNGDCKDVDKTALEFFKIHDSALIDYREGRYSQGGPQEQTGYWGTDAIFYDNGNKQTVKIPSDIPSGNYVLRTEVMSIHNNGAVANRQFWPQAFNIKVTGGDDSAQLPAGTKGTELYSSSDALLKWDLYWHDAEKTFAAAAGPTVPAAIAANVSKKARRHAKDFSS
ncbi:lytic polysaccharide monooxygenase [Melanomma pulvis-pyrius CBS 109.77]|uniref:Lytic polysaccharide monooxygenase n=1 Tax=Melanomma pulvis-pyrius CBS 109.77 TaxID=1314802 RepID=A0A6A6X0M3_9PLEO|nr:lytic polysaccharide monooxygenase [Melanomma pulvis-pyrius CBS 109.77]